MAELTRIGVVSLGTFVSVIAGAQAAIFGLPLLIFEAVAPGGGVMFWLLFTVGMMFGGFVSGAFTAVLYNAVASVAGGIEMNFESTS